jgi:tryptophan synthase beta chain
MPRQWYNILADIKLNPPAGPGRQPGEARRPGAGLSHEPDRAGGQHRALDRHPRPVLDVLSIWRPSPAGAGPPWKRPWARRPGSTTRTRRQPPRQPQAQHRRSPGLLQQGLRHRALTTETGAGQWGSALSFACAQFGLECKVFMVRVSFDQKPYRKAMMETWGGSAWPAPAPKPRPAGRSWKRPRHPRQPGHRHQRSHRGRRERHQRQDPLLPGQRAQPRHAAPDHHRPGSQRSSWP